MHDKHLEKLARMIQTRPCHHYRVVHSRRPTKKQLQNYDELTVRETADMLKVSMMTIYRLLNRGALPYVKVQNPTGKTAGYKRYIPTHVVLRLQHFMLTYKDTIHNYPANKIKQILNGSYQRASPAGRKLRCDYRAIQDRQNEKILECRKRKDRHDTK